MKLDSVAWQIAYALLESDVLTQSEACSAIVRLGKPFDQERIRRAAPLVSKYLEHSDFLVRHEALWFVGCWGKLPDYLPFLLKAVKQDPDADNRSFAARCIGQVLLKYKDPTAIKALIKVAFDLSENPEVRLSSYSALILAHNGESARAEALEFEPMGSKSLPDMSESWLQQVSEWADRL